MVVIAEPGPVRACFWWHRVQLGHPDWSSTSRTGRTASARARARYEACALTIAEELSAPKSRACALRSMAACLRGPADRRSSSDWAHRRFQCLSSPPEWGGGRHSVISSVDGLGDAPVRGGGADPEPSRLLGVRMTIAKMSQGGRGLPPRHSSASIGCRDGGVPTARQGRQVGKDHCQRHRLQCSHGSCAA
jgi:hypothetical protein